LRYTLFAQCEGVLAQSSEHFWAVVQNGTVLDASVSARNQGIREGMTEKAARALAPSMDFHPFSPQLTTVMETLHNIVKTYTPWLEVVDCRRFYAQIPVTEGAPREVRQILSDCHSALSDEQRICIGFAESKGAARALVEWHRIGRVPEMGVFAFKQQRLIVSPRIWRKGQGFSSTSTTTTDRWLHQFPMTAMWVLPKSVRYDLLALGVKTFGQLQSIPDENLKVHFGKEIWQVKEMFQSNAPIATGSPPVPETFSATWTAPAGEAATIAVLPQIAEGLMNKLCRSMFQWGLGTKRMETRWETEDKGVQVSSRVFGKVLSNREALAPPLLLELAKIREESICLLEISVRELCSVKGQQLQFTVKNNRVLPIQYQSAERLHDVLLHVNRKFPNKLKLGMKAGFRELRLEAMDAQ